VYQKRRINETLGGHKAWASKKLPELRAGHCPHHSTLGKGGFTPVRLTLLTWQDSVLT